MRYNDANDIPKEEKIMGIDNRIVGETIARLRVQAELTQQQLAAILNVSHQAVSKWENGAALPDIQTLLSLTELFGVTMEQLLSGDIPKAEPESPRKEEPSLSGWFRGAISEETRKSISAFAEDARRAAADIAEKVGDAIGLADDGTIPSDEADIGISEDAPVSDDARDGLTMDRLIALAPFMTRAKLSEAAMSLADCGDWESLVRLAPFLSREAIGKLARRVMAKPTEQKHISALAPFMSGDDLYELIVSNIELFRFQDLRRLAPHLRREKVDALFTYFSTGRFPETDAAPAKSGPNLGSILDQALSGIGNAVSGIGSAVNDAIGSICPKPKPGRAPSEFKDRIAKAALSAGNWQWLNAHIAEIGDPALLSEIALTAIRPENFQTLSPMAAQIAPLLSDEAKTRLFSQALKDGNWEFLAEIRDCATEETANLVVTEAANADSGERESAYAVIEMYAPKISREALERLTEAAIREDNWLLINALTESV